MTLTPAVSPDRLWPAEAAWAARPEIGMLRLLGFRPVLTDMITGMMTGFMGTRPAVRHACVATEVSGCCSGGRASIFRNGR